MMSLELYQFLLNDINNGTGNINEKYQLTENAFFSFDPLTHALFLNTHMNENTTHLSIYANIHDFFNELSAYDESNIVKAFCYLRGVTEETTYEQLFSK